MLMCQGERETRGRGCRGRWRERFRTHHSRGGVGRCWRQEAMGRWYGRSKDGIKEGKALSGDRRWVNKVGRRGRRGICGGRRGSRREKDRQGNFAFIGREADGVSSENNCSIPDRCRGLTCATLLWELQKRHLQVILRSPSGIPRRSKWNVVRGGHSKYGHGSLLRNE